MSIALFEETSEIADEKDLRQRITITQNTLMDELSEISASASGKPGVSSNKRVQKVNPEASSSGKVLGDFHGMAKNTGMFPFQLMCLLRHDDIASRLYGFVC
jgi:hypothetical protein